LVKAVADFDVLSNHAPILEVITSI
jgi:hypothetical protein